MGGTKNTALSIGISWDDTDETHKHGYLAETVRRPPDISNFSLKEEVLRAQKEMLILAFKITCKALGIYYVEKSTGVALTFHVPECACQQNAGF
ncbi:MAG: hypothetical protein JWP16_1882 [Alphaproteobacteria bacterium]|nr:hypothetical protein [Alphaproteobacteria bacterium]